MNNVNNLHSLLGGKWMITEQFANSLYPYLSKILSKGEITVQSAEHPKPFYFASVTGSQTKSIKQESDQQEYVAILDIKSPILKYSQSCGPRGTQSMMATMKMWEKNPSIKGVLLDIDSGGGQVAGTGEFAKFIKNYSKPVVVYTNGMLCSAAYYIASGAKEIIANPYSDCIGSIGTMIKYVNLEGYYKKMGAQVIEEYATKSTHKNHAFRTLAATGDVKALITEELDPINEVFHADVKAYRPKVKDENFNGHHTSDINKALEMGLIDTINDKQYAINRVFKLANQDKTNNHNPNEQNMSTEQSNYNQIAAAIGEETIKLSSKILTGKKGFFLTENQLTTLEQKMEASNTDALEQAQTEARANLDKITQLQSAVNSVEASVKEALTTAGLDASTDIEESIKLLGEKVKEYGSKEGSDPTQVHSNVDRNAIEENDYSLWNEINN